MTDKEKKEHPFWKTTDGYLKTYDYKEAWQIAWDKASQEEKNKVKALANFSAEKFKEITGIDIEENYIEIDGKKVSKATVKEALKQFINKL